MRRRRTIYYNDARHYYLFVPEPPIRLEEAYGPVDEAAGTAVDTFIYGVSRSDGCFYPSKVGNMFGSGPNPFLTSPHWRTRYNLESLIARGIDPLKLLIDRVHEKGMEFIASHRFSDLVGLGGHNIDPPIELADGTIFGGIPSNKFQIGSGHNAEHPDYTHSEVRQHKFAMFEELVTRYESDGIELDFATGPQHFKQGGREENASLMTDLVRRISETAKTRRPTPAVVGARVFPTEQMNINADLDVRTWLREGLVDYVLPMLYGFNVLDPNMPFKWLVEAAHQHDASVYGMLHPFVEHDRSGPPEKSRANLDTMRAAMANYWDYGVDGLYTWFLAWPFGDLEHRILTEMGDPDLIMDGNKQYKIARRTDRAADLGYSAALPVHIPRPHADVKYAVPFYIADDVQSSDTALPVRIRMLVDNLLSGDRLSIDLNGQSLTGELWTRRYPGLDIQYDKVLLEITLLNVRPRQGENLLEIALLERPARMGGGIAIEELDVFVEYAPYPGGSGYRTPIGY